MPHAVRATNRRSAPFCYTLWLREIEKERRRFGEVFGGHGACIGAPRSQSPEFFPMKSLNFRVWFCLSVACSSTLLSAVASADAAADLTAKGDVNVTDQRQQLPPVAAN